MAPLPAPDLPPLPADLADRVRGFLAGDRAAVSMTVIDGADYVAVARAPDCDDFILVGRYSTDAAASAALAIYHSPRRLTWA